MGSSLPEAADGFHPDPTHRPMAAVEGWVAIVDDDASIRRSVVRALQCNDIPARGFGSAEEYLDRPPPDEPRCIVLDIHLPGLSGFELQDRLLAEGHAPAIVFISAFDDAPSGYIAARAGPHGFLRKPFPTLALIELVRRCVDGASPLLES